MRKGYKHAKKDVLVPNLTSSHPGERLLAARVNKPKGAVSALTKLKTEIGVDSVETLKNYIKGNGALKFIDTIHSLEGKDFIVGYTAVLEYVLPKQVRTTNVNVDLSIDDITFE